jgi:nitrate/nitrite transporter NarK
LAASRQVWLLCGQYFCSSYGWYFYITWLPTYLKEARGQELGASALLGILPLFLGGLGSLVSGFLTAPLTRLTGSMLKTRRLLAYVGFSGASILLVVSTRMHNPVPAMIAMGLASFSNDLVMPGSWGACMDVGGKYAGTVSGAMNMMGNLGGAASPTIIGYMLRWTGNNWDMTFYVSAAVYATAVFLWRFLDPVTPLEGTEAA